MYCTWSQQITKHYSIWYWAMLRMCAAANQVTAVAVLVKRIRTWDPTNKYSNSTTSCLYHATGIIRVLRPFTRQYNSTHHLSHDNESLGQALLSTSWWFSQPGHWIRSQAGGEDWHVCAGPSTVSHPGSASCKRAVCISAATRQLPSHLSLVQILTYFLHPSLHLLRNITCTTITIFPWAQSYLSLNVN